jgi:hypothetical protein
MVDGDEAVRLVWTVEHGDWCGEAACTEDAGKKKRWHDMGYSSSLQTIHTRDIGRRRRKQKREIEN